MADSTNVLKLSAGEHLVFTVECFLSFTEYW